MSKKAATPERSGCGVPLCKQPTEAAGICTEHLAELPAADRAGLLNLESRVAALEHWRSESVCLSRDGIEQMLRPIDAPPAT